MKEKRRDIKGRILHTGESQRTDGKYLGSDISAIFGENHFKTNLDLYYAKTGKVPAVPEEESSASRLNKLWGHISEEYVDAWLSEKYPYNDIITDTNI